MSTHNNFWPSLPNGCSQSMWGKLPMLHTIVGDHQVDLSLFGGQLLGWKYKGRDIFFLNREYSIVDGKTPYRGGAPVCFPHFNRGALYNDGKLRDPSHGPVRSQLWEVLDITKSTSSFSAKLGCNAQSTDEANPVPLYITMVYSVDNTGLKMLSTVKNKGARTARFHLALHTYFDAPSPDSCVIEGLGRNYLDGMKDLVATVMPEDNLNVQSPLDRVYPTPKPHMSLTTTTYKLEIEQKGFNNAVVWNPGEKHTLKDMRAPTFICLESVAVLPAPSIQPGASWIGEIRYTPEKRDSHDLPD